MAEYAGESVAKKICRVRLYKRTRDLLRAVGHDPSEAAVLFLVGPEAGEAGCIKHILKAPAELAVGVDIDDKVLPALEKKLPGCSFLQIDLRNENAPTVLRKILNIRSMHYDRKPRSSYSFVHLDLMGNLSSNAVKIYGNFGASPEPGGVVAVTFLRGREYGNYKKELEWAKEMVKHMDFGRKGRRILGYDSVRSSLHFWNLFHETSKRVIRAMIRIRPEMLERLGLSSIEDVEDDRKVLRIASHMWDDIGGYMPVASYAYQGGVSPMGVMAAQWMPHSLRTKHWWSTYFGDKCFPPKHGRRVISSVIGQDDIGELLMEADELYKEGYSKQQVAEILNTSTTTLGAWKAHRTMGTYDEANAH